MTNRREIELAFRNYYEARRWLDKHPITAAGPKGRHAAHRIVAHWAKRIQDLSSL
jgi:hypothetical protein